jgi:hypothetical protein
MLTLVRWLPLFSFRYRELLIFGLAGLYSLLLAAFLPGIEALAQRVRRMALGSWLAAALIASALLGVRLWRVTAPPLDNDSVRQPITLDLARNQCLFDLPADRLVTTQAWRGGPELLAALRAGPIPHQDVFPAYHYLVSRLFCAFGPHPALARLLTLAGSLLGVLGLQRFVTIRAGPGQAWLAAALYAVLPLGIYYSRAALRQSFDLGLALAALWCFAEWAKPGPGRRGWLWASAVLFSLALASSPPLGTLGIVCLALAWERDRGRLLRRWELWLAAIVVVVPALAWYGLVPGTGEILSADGRSFASLSYYGQWLSLRFVQVVPAVVIGFLTLPVGLLLVGLARASREQRLVRLAAGWLAAGVVYLAVFDPRAAFVSREGLHLYAYLVLAPPLAILMALGLDALHVWLQSQGVILSRASLALWAGLSIFVPGLYFLQPLYGAPAAAEPLAHALREALAPDETFLLLTGDVGTGYLAERRGAAYDVLRGSQALSIAQLQALLCAAPAVVAVQDPVELHSAAGELATYLQDQYPVAQLASGSWLFDTRRPPRRAPPACDSTIRSAFP